MLLLVDSEFRYNTVLSLFTYFVCDEKVKISELRNVTFVFGNFFFKIVTND